MSASRFDVLFAWQAKLGIQANVRKRKNGPRQHHDGMLQTK
jgi:hypothetical protein